MLISFLTILVSVQVLVAEELSNFSKFEHYNFENWTTCDQFLANTTFDRAKLLDVDWKIFYYWSLHLEESYNIRFSVPSPTLVDRFRVELDEEIAPPVNWTLADTFMETSVDFSGLFLRSNTSGLFKLIPSLAFEHPDVPVLMFGLKYVEPGYLGIMNCRQQLCFALAPVDKMPPPDQLEVEAKKFGFYGEFSRSYLMTPPPSTVPLPNRAEPDDDDDEDEHFEIAKDPEDDTMQFL